MDRQNEIMMKEIPAQIKYMPFNEAHPENINSENEKKLHYLKRDQIIMENDEIEENNNDININNSNERFYLNEIYNNNNNNNNNNYINENENEIETEEEMRENRRNNTNIKYNKVNNNLYINNRSPLQMKKIEKNNNNNNYEYNEILHEDQAVYISNKSPRFNKNFGNSKEGNNIYKSEGIIRETRNYQLYTSNYSKTGKNLYIPKSYIGSEKTTFMENKNKNEEIESINKNNNNKKKDLEIKPEIKNSKIINAIPIEKYIEISQENQTFNPNKIEKQTNNNNDQYDNINYRKKKKRIIIYRRHKPIVIQHFDVQIIQEPQENNQDDRDREYQEKIYNYKNTNNIIKENEENKVPPVQNIYKSNSTNFYRNHFYYHNNPIPLPLPLSPYFNNENININRYTPKQTVISLTPMRTIVEPVSPYIYDKKISYIPYSNRYYNNERFRTLTPPNPPKRRQYEYENNRRYINNDYNNDIDMRRKNSYSLYPQRKEGLIIYEEDDINNINNENNYHQHQHQYQYNRGQRLRRNNY